MIKNIITGLILLSVFISTHAFAYTRGRDPFEKPQIGLWFGPVTPVYTTAEALNTYFGGGLFLRTNSMLKGLKIGLDSSYQYYRSQGVDQMSLWPVYGNLIYKLPINFPLSFQIKAGAGSCRVETRPDGFTQWDPLFMCGIETSFPAGKIINIGLRIDYLLIYEKYISGAKRNGHVINSGLTLFCNLGGSNR